ncbi:DUF397 domain-containing protein [Haloechinothrix sp. LS1_15]|uniref:DUF397 domain-containing protein n=1 Tax=Haloechinothrix sp. LS1_15 TaxID=2652248 RepID=UPI0029469555|nr:DUF397 domain-containing protein [Haloechinothrix sp. LS1_15]MDV6012927.1 DUF397 domain-containing protein [Haloechinothrix sp. LS1_15]
MNDGARWRKSRYSGGGNDCVEVDYRGADALVRDSKQPSSGVLAVPGSSWRLMLSAARTGQLEARRGQH